MRRSILNVAVNIYFVWKFAGVLLGLPLLPSYSEEFNVDTMRFGVNYASAAAGILDVTGFHFVSIYFHLKLI